MSLNVFELFAKLGLDSSEYDKGLSSAKGALSTFGGAAAKGFGTIAKVGVSALTAATTAAVGFGAASVKTGADFDSSMSQVAATLGKTMSEMQTEIGQTETSFGHFEGNLREFAQFMGSNTAFSATQAADALNYMALAGYDAQKSMDMLPGVLNLAAAGSMDLATASDMITDTQSALGLSMEQTTQMIDQMAAAAASSNTSVEQLGSAMLTVGGTAKVLKGGTNELAQVLGLLADNGTKGAEGGTALRNILTSIQGDKFEKTFGKMGIEAYDAQGKLRPLKDIFLEMSDAMSDWSDEAKTDIINQTFNARDLKNVQALLGTTEERWDSLYGKIKDSKDAASEMAATQLDNLDGDVTIFKSALEGAQIAISDGLTPTLREFVQYGTNAVSDLSDAFKEGGMSGAMAQLGTVLSDGIAIVTDKLPEMVDAGMSLLGALGQGIIDNSGQILNAFSEIGGMIFEWVLNVLENASTALSEFDWGGVAAQIAEFLRGGFTDGAIDFLDIAMTIIENLVSGISQALPELLPAAVDVILSLGESLIDNTDKLIDAAIAIDKGLADSLINSLGVVIDKCPEIMEKLTIALIQNAPKLFAARSEIGQAIFGGLIDLVPQYIDSFIQSFQNVGAQIITTLEPTATAILNWLTTRVITPVKNYISKLITDIQAFFAPLVSIISPLLEALQYLFETVWTAITIIVSGAVEKVLSVVREKFNAVKNVVAPILNEVKTTVTNVFNSLSTAAESPLNKLKESITKKFGEIQKFIENIIQDAKNWGADLINSIIEGITANIGKLSSAITGVADEIRKKLHFSEPDEGPLSDFHTYAPDMMALFAKGVEDNTKLVTDQIEKSFDFKNLITMPDTLRVGFASGIYADAEHAANERETAILSRMDAMLSVMSEYFPEIAEKTGKGYGIEAINRGLGVIY